jgi:hypothetical protein
MPAAPWRRSSPFMKKRSPALCVDSYGRDRMLGTLKATMEEKLFNGGPSLHKLGLGMQDDRRTPNSQSLARRG